MRCNKNTGILLFINGYGANPNSNVYKKMRNEFAYKYNLITVQCEYFGVQFMGVDINIKENKFTEEEIKLMNLPYKEGSNHTRKIIKRFDENKENMNDMGPIQAIDNLTSISTVIEILKTIT